MTTRSPEGGLLAVEPLCRGHEHAHVNAALLACARLAYPQRSIRFLGEPRHLDAVRLHLDAAGIDGVTMARLQRSRGYDDLASAKLGEAWFCRRVLADAAAHQETRVLFTAINTPIIFFLKAWTTLGYRSIRVAGIGHSMMQHLASPPASLAGRIMGLRNTLEFGGARRCQVIVPGESIRRNTLDLVPGAAPCLHALDLMYLFADRPTSMLPHDVSPRFGFIGVGTRRKGIEAFHRLAAHVHAEATDRGTEFVLVGQLMDPPSDPALAAHVLTPVPDRFMEEAERDAWLDRIHYAVFPYDAAEYRFVASAAFLDAVAWAKPVLALRNDYIARQFERLGDIGHLCRDEAELADTALRLVRTPDPVRYRAQQDALRAGRRFFSPQTLAPALRAIFETNGAA